MTTAAVLVDMVALVQEEHTWDLDLVRELAAAAPHPVGTGPGQTHGGHALGLNHRREC